MDSSRTAKLVVCTVALGGAAGVVAVLISRRKKQQLEREAELRSLEEERVKREVEASRDKAARHRARKQELDSPKSLTRRAEKRRQEEERKRLEEEARIAADKRRIEEEEKLIAEMKSKAEEEERRVAEARRRAEEEEKHLAEAKLRAEEAEIRKAEEAKRKADEKLRVEEEEKREAEAKLRAEEEKKRLAEEMLKAHEEEKRKHEEEQRAREEAEKQAEKKQLEEEQSAREEAERVRLLEEEWKRKAEEHAAKHHEREEEVNRSHAQEEEVIGDAKAEPEVQQAAARSAVAEADLIAEEEEWQKAEKEMIRIDHQPMVGVHIRINTTGELALVEETTKHCQFCKVVFADDLADATPSTTVWARWEAVEAVPTVGDEVTVKTHAAQTADSPGSPKQKGGEVILKTVKRIGELSQVNDTDVPYQVKFSDGHSDFFKARDVEIHRRHGQSTRFRSARGRLGEFDESGTSCFVHFVEGTLAGETAWLDEDSLETIPIIGCSMRVKSRNCRGELIKYDGSARAADWPYMIQLEDGNKDWYRNTDAEPVFEVGCWVRVATPGLFIGEISEPPHEHPYQIRFSGGDKEGLLDWSRRCNFSPSAEVGSPVLDKKRGRSGTVVLKDDSDMPCKVLFDDGALPQSDWYREGDLEVVTARPSAKTM